MDICKNSKMNLIIIRPSLVYGNKVKGNLNMMIKGIKGWFPCLPKTNNKKSLIHVDDLAMSMIYLIKIKNQNLVIYNVTDGIKYSSYDIYKMLCIALGKNISIIKVPLWIFRIISFIHPSLKQKINKLFANEYHSNEKITLLGFEPQFNLSEIFKKSF